MTKSLPMEDHHHGSHVEICLHLVLGVYPGHDPENLVHLALVIVPSRLVPEHCAPTSTTTQLRKKWTQNGIYLFCYIFSSPIFVFYN